MSGNLLIGIGDLHGHYPALEAILYSLNREYGIFKEENVIKDNVKLIFNGDYIDRGNQSLKVIDRIKAIQEKSPTVETNAGNHELLALAGLETARESLTSGGLTFYQSFSVHGNNGGVQFIKEFEGNDDFQRINNYIKRMDRTGDIGSWMRKLKPGSIQSFYGKRVLFLHAGIPPRLETLLKIDHEFKKITDHFDCPTAKLGGSEEKYLRSEIVGARSVFWDRSLPAMSNEEAQTLVKNIEVDYVVIGHTPNRDGIMRSYGGKIFNIDIGMCLAYGGNDPAAIVFSETEINALYARKGKFNFSRF